MDKIQTFVYSINICIASIGISIFLSAVTACSQFECNYFMHLQFYIAIFSCNSTVMWVDATLSCDFIVSGIFELQFYSWCNFELLFLVVAILSCNFYLVQFWVAIFIWCNFELQFFWLVQFLVAVFSWCNFEFQFYSWCNFEFQFLVGAILSRNF